MKAIAEIKLRVLLVLLGGYLLFNYPFMLLRIPPSGFGVPLGELFLVFALMTTDVPLVVTKLGKTIYLLPILIWWVFGLARVTVDFLSHGIWAFRDATQVIQSIYVIVAFSLVGRPANLARLMRWLPVVLTLACIYGLSYSLKLQIASLSPKLTGADGESVPLLGSYATTPIVMLWTAFYCLITPKSNELFSRIRIPVAGFLISFTIIVMQTRTTYLELVGLSLLLLLFRPRAFAELVMALLILILAVAMLTAFDWHINGRLTDNFSFSFLIEHVEATIGIGANRATAVGAAAKGVGLRITWWKNIYDRLTADTATLLTGLGYGIPLTNFRDTFGDLVREPHNSYISVVARLGLLGMIAWIAVQIGFVRAWFHAYRGCQRVHWHQSETLLLMILAFAALVLIDAVGEDALEKSYEAIPYYCLWGVALRIAYAMQPHPTTKTFRTVVQPGARLWRTERSIEVR